MKCYVAYNIRLVGYNICISQKQLTYIHYETLMHENSMIFPRFSHDFLSCTFHGNFLKFMVSPINEYSMKMP